MADLLNKHFKTIFLKILKELKKVVEKVMKTIHGQMQISVMSQKT